MWPFSNKTRKEDVRALQSFGCRLNVDSPYVDHYITPQGNHVYPTHRDMRVWEFAVSNHTPTMLKVVISITFDVGWFKNSTVQEFRRLDKELRDRLGEACK